MCNSDIFKPSHLGCLFACVLVQFATCIRHTIYDSNFFFKIWEGKNWMTGIVYFVEDWMYVEKKITRQKHVGHQISQAAYMCM